MVIDDSSSELFSVFFMSQLSDIQSHRELIIYLLLFSDRMHSSFVAHYSFDRSRS